MNVATSHDAEGPGARDAFERWRREHPGGFVLNYGSPSDMMLHRPNCTHFIFREPRSLTSYKKVCAGRVEDLVAWAADHGTIPFACAAAVRHVSRARHGQAQARFRNLTAAPSRKAVTSSGA